MEGSGGGSEDLPTSSLRKEANNDAILSPSSIRQVPIGGGRRRGEEGGSEV